MAKFPSTLLPQSNEPLEIQKAILDLLDKINQNAGASSQSVPPGVIHEYAGATAPAGYLLCDGASYRRVDYPALFAAIGVTWGTADSAHFNVPDFQGVSPVGTGAQDINARTKTGPALGEVREDQGQAWQLGTVEDATGLRDYWGRAQTRDVALSTSATPNYCGVNFGTASQGSNLRLKAMNDGTNGTPRTGAYTHGPEVGVNFIIKV